MIFTQNIPVCVSLAKAADWLFAAKDNTKPDFFIMEIWKDIPGYEGYYQVSTNGNIRSLNRIISQLKCSKCQKNASEKCCGKLYLKNIERKGRLLKPTINRYGYRTIMLSLNGKVKCKRIARLVFETFIGKIKKGNNIDHVDNNKMNDSLENLQSISQRLNMVKMAANLPNKRSKYVGVRWREANKKWIAVIMKNGRQICLGHFDTEKEASISYNKELKSQLSF